MRFGITRSAPQTEPLRPRLVFRLGEREGLATPRQGPAFRDRPGVEIVATTAAQIALRRDGAVRVDGLLHADNPIGPDALDQAPTRHLPAVPGLAAGLADLVQRRRINAEEAHALTEQDQRFAVDDVGAFARDLGRSRETGDTQNENQTQEPAHAAA